MIRSWGHVPKGGCEAATDGRDPARRQITDEFKAGAIRLVLDEGKIVGAVTRELDLAPTALPDWVRKAQGERTKGRRGLIGIEHEKLTLLRKKVRELRIKRKCPKNSRGLPPRNHA